MNLEHIKKRLAKSTNTSLEAVESVTDYYAKGLIAMARKAHTNCPEGDRGKFWLETAMASHAAGNKDARKIIEAKVWKLFGEGF
jgi:hypothetical protein